VPNSTTSIKVIFRCSTTLLPHEGDGRSPWRPQFSCQQQGPHLPRRLRPQPKPTPRHPRSFLKTCSMLQLEEHRNSHQQVGETLAVVALVTQAHSVGASSTMAPSGAQLQATASLVATTHCTPATHGGTGKLPSSSSTQASSSNVGRPPASSSHPNNNKKGFNSKGPTLHRPLGFIGDSVTRIYMHASKALDYSLNFNMFCELCFK
jgi:hypothetical protein